jgi:alpha-glucosidase (family GH31 glycosyl hydrolase)
MHYDYKFSSYVSEVKTRLPHKETWYNFNNKILENRKSPIFQNLTDSELGVWIKAGAIIPTLLHKNELSILRAFNNSIKLEVYLDS